MTDDQPPQSDKASTDRTLEKLRINRAFQLSIIGLALAAVLVVALLIAGWKTGSDVSAVVGLFTSVLGTLVGAFFGLQVGAADKAKVEERADNAQQKTEFLLGEANQDTMTKARSLYPNLFK